jgi:hypothetical protein
MPDMIKGSCLCGQVTFQVGGEVLNTASCHCNICRKNTGAAFNTVVMTKQDHFKIVSGEDKIRSFQLGERATKHFCEVCGTAVYNVNTQFPGIVLVPIGTLDDPGRFPPTLNVFCESMLPWVTELTHQTRFPQGVPRKRSD